MNNCNRHIADEALVKKSQNLGDLELAILICLIAQEHCRIDTESVFLDDLAEELQEIAAGVFGLGFVVIECSKKTTVEEFNNLISHLEIFNKKPNSPIWNCRDNSFPNSALPTGPHLLVSKKNSKQRSVINVVIAKNLDNAPKQVQTRALELMRMTQVSSRGSSHCTPKNFLLIALLATGKGLRLDNHLNDNIFISHFHHPQDRHTDPEGNIDDETSISSVVRKSANFRISREVNTPIISAQEIDRLRDLSNAVTFGIEVKRYQMNIVSFLRLHRAIDGGITATATRLFGKLATCLAPLHNLDYVTPSLISLAAKKIYSHRIQIVRPENERSMQWGSDIESVAASLEGIDAERVLEDVLGSSGAEVPL